MLPVIVSLFVGGFITSFKGFGVELEATLQKPVKSLDLTGADSVSVAVADIPGDEKRSLSHLQSVSIDGKLKTRWLRLTSGRQGYYESSAIQRYLSELPNIIYLEILSTSGKFICFLPISVFRNGLGDIRQAFNQENIRKLIEAIEADDVPKAFPESALSLTVSSDKSMIDVLKVMRSENAQFAAVVTPIGDYSGVVFSDDIERKIADSVLLATAA